MNKENSPIGIFDSGIGGLTVLKEVRRFLPSEDIVYLGDTAHLPYGTKSSQTIIKLSIANILFLLRMKVKFIIVACNSTSSVALPRIKNFFSLPLLGVVEAGVKAVLEKRVKKIGIIGTPATIKSSTYQKLILKKTKGVKIITQACPLFVPLVEEGWINSKVTEEVAKIYLKKFRGKVDLLILGCTHYPLLKGVIRKRLKGIGLLDSAEEVAKEAKRMLRRANLLRKKNVKGKLSFFLTDYSPNFSKLTKLILKEKITPKIVENV